MAKDVGVMNVLFDAQMTTIICRRHYNRQDNERTFAHKNAPPTSSRRRGITRR